MEVRFVGHCGIDLLTLSLRLLTQADGEPLTNLKVAPNEDRGRLTTEEMAVVDDLIRATDKAID